MRMCARLKIRIGRCALVASRKKRAVRAKCSLTGLNNLFICFESKQYYFHAVHICAARNSEWHTYLTKLFSFLMKHSLNQVLTHAARVAAEHHPLWSRAAREGLWLEQNDTCKLIICVKRLALFVAGPDFSA